MTPLRLFLVCIAFIAASQPSLLHASSCDTTVSSGKSIQAAIDDAASSGYTICIGAGTYYEQLTLTDGITLKGEELGRTIIDGSGSGTVITGATSAGISNVTIKNGEIGISASNITGLTISNVVIVGNDYGIYCDGATSIIMFNSVIDQNKSGIYAINSSEIIFWSSILYSNSVDISSGDDPDDPVPSTYYGNYNLIYNNTTTYYYYDEDTDTYTDTTSIYTADPLFVYSASNDYHLKSASPAIDAGYSDSFYNDAVDGTINDIGAYGGPDMDVTPFPVSGLDASAEEDNSLTLSWPANNAYNIAGYRIYFDSDASGALYEGTSAEGASPIEVVGGDVTDDYYTYTLSGLTATATAPEPPTGLMTAPGNKSIALSWSAVEGASGYMLYWGTSPGNYTESKDVGNVTSYTVSGLTNGTTYYFAASTYNYTYYYLTITAYDTSQHESVILSENEVSAPLSNTTAGAKSDEVSEYPEESVPFPNLKDEGLCFIATAAYGSNMEPDVVILRKFRDHYLLTNTIGRGFTALYYRYSPPMADFIRDHELLKSIVRAGLLPFVLMAKLLLSSTLAMWLLLLMFAAFLTASLLPAMRRKLS